MHSDVHDMHRSISQFNPPMANMINDTVCLQQEIDVISAELRGLCKSNVLWNPVSHLFQLFLHQTLALVCASTSAFAPQPSAFVSKELSASTPLLTTLVATSLSRTTRSMSSPLLVSWPRWPNPVSSGRLKKSKAQEEQGSRSWHFSFQVGTIVAASRWPRDPSTLANPLWLGPTCLSHLALTILIPVPVIGAAGFASAAAAFVAVGIIPDGWGYCYGSGGATSDCPRCSWSCCPWCDASLAASALSGKLTKFKVKNVSKRSNNWRDWLAI